VALNGPEVREEGAASARRGGRLFGWASKPKPERIEKPFFLFKFSKVKAIFK
jgi:hypothetical protein